MEESDSICDEITIAVTDSYPNIAKLIFLLFSPSADIIKVQCRYTFDRKCCNLIGLATHYLFRDRQKEMSTAQGMAHLY